MDVEKKMITNGKPKNDANVVASFSELAHDVVELTELQGQLLKIDVLASWQKMRTGVILLVVGVCLLLGCVPILWLAIAEALVEFGGWSRTPALGAALAIGLAVAGGIGAAAWLRLRTTFSSFERSREELVRNIRWIKSSLKRQPRPQRREMQHDVRLPS